MCWHAASGTGKQNRDDVIAQRHHQNLAFWIAKADIKLDDFRAIWCDHQANVQHSLVGMPAFGQTFQHGQGDVFFHLGHKFWRHHRGRAVGAHPAGVRALIAVAQALVILTGWQGQMVHPIGKHKYAGFFAGHEFFDDEFCRGIAKLA